MYYVDNVRLYLLLFAVQLMIALVWRDCGPWDVIGGLLIIVPLCVTWWVAQLWAERKHT